MSNDVRNPDTRVTAPVEGDTREGTVKSYRYGLVYVQLDGEESLTAFEPGVLEVVE